MKGGLVVLFCDGLGDDHDDWKMGSLFLLVKCLPWLVEYGTLVRCGCWIYECFKSLDSTDSSHYFSIYVDVMTGVSAHIARWQME